MIVDRAWAERNLGFDPIAGRYWGQFLTLHPLASNCGVRV